MIDTDLNARVHALDRALREAALPGLRETVPAYASLLVHYDPLVVGYVELATELERIMRVGRRRGAPRAGASEARSPRRSERPAERPPQGEPFEIPVVYGGDAGPDLEEVAAKTGMGGDEVIRRHAGGEYVVAMIGFAPGFPYLMGMDPALACPRLESPRVRVPAGSVGIADTQTGIYPFAMPGGWRIIGRTPERLFDPGADPPSRLRPGDRLRFVPAQIGALDRAPEDGPAAEPLPVSGAIRVVEPGFATTVQDRGRWGYQRYGVPPSGAADPTALRAGNAALGNPPDAAALEITAGGVSFEFIAASRVALAGAPVDAWLDARRVAWSTATDADPGMILRLGRPAAGSRTYLCVAGGLDVPLVLGSRSTYLAARFGGFQGRSLRAGDALPVCTPVATAPGRLVVGIPRDGEGRSAPDAPGRGTVDLPFVPGAQWDDFAAEDRHAFTARRWHVSHQADRVGIRLDGEPLPTGGRSRRFVSDGTVTGAIQVAGDGRPIVLLVDRQTTGGYPKLGAVASTALHVLGQLGPGNEVRFHPISVAEAQAALRTAVEAGR
jgi:KipI family sensor histidine kinase inhibitor